MERDASDEHQFRQADVLFEAELIRHPSHGLQRLHHVQRGFMDAGRAGSALAPGIHAMLGAEFVRNGDVALAMDLGFAPESAPKLFRCLGLVRTAPSLKADAPVSSPGDNAAHRSAEAFENGFEIEPRLWSEPGRAQSSSSVARGYA